MEIKELMKFIEKQAGILNNKYYKDYSDREKILERVLKINEEFGELCDEISKRFGNQRTSKMEIENSIEHEFADVLICVLLLAQALDIDVDKALDEKIKKIKKRFSNGFIINDASREGTRVDWNEN